MMLAYIFVFGKGINSRFIFKGLAFYIILSLPDWRLKLLTIFCFEGEIISMILVQDMFVIISLRRLMLWNISYFQHICRITGMLAVIFNSMIQLLEILLNAIYLLHQTIGTRVKTQTTTSMHRLQSQFYYLLYCSKMVGFGNSTQENRQLRNLTDQFLHLQYQQHSIKNIHFHTIIEDSSFKQKQKQEEAFLWSILIKQQTRYLVVLETLDDYIYLNSIKKMTKNQQFLRTKIGQFEQANVNFRTKLEDLFFYLKLCPLELTQEYIAKPSTLLIRIKWLILFHYIIIEEPINRLEIVGDLIAQLTVPNHAELSSVEKLMYEKLFNPYKLYLQKRQLFNQTKHIKENSAYQLINLIRNALSFTDVLFTIGRYLFKKNYFLVEFNIVIGRDLAALYKRMRNQLSEEQKILNAQIIQKMNEGLYNIYYNCYFSQYTSRLAPAWINTQHIFQQISQRKQSIEQANTKEVQQTIIIDGQISLYDTFVKGLEQCEEPKSASTIASHNDKENDGVASSRLQFISFASNLLLEMRKIESAKTLIH